MAKKITVEGLITFRTSVLAQMLARMVDVSVTEELGLSSRQWRTLVSLYRLGPSTASEIVRFSHLDKSQISRAVFENEAKGLLTQTVDPDDRRRAVIALTPEGSRTLEKGLRGTLHRQHALEGCLSAEDRAAFYRIMDTLTGQARKMLDEASGKNG
ncbi:MarR family winged helix-turn-helix transcriptional regulator [Achromobacter sp. NPDC058515]|uniref:MarR family winged helix-turn-helix transcriptional regulator n=1 Tax=Achromobacter sp. NPDC058515 TaxID=3346533 RepID=UPI0036473E3B